MEGFPRQNLQTVQINPVTFVQPQVTIGKIIAHHANQFDRGEKTGRDRRVAGGAAEQARVFCAGSLDRIQGCRADN